INAALNNYGSTIDLDNVSYQHKGNDSDFTTFLNEAAAGQVDVAFFLNVNPAYDYFDREKVKGALAKVKLKVSFADREDETAELVDILAPNHNYLESWGDSNAREGYFTVVQPTINPVFNTRQAEQSLLIWSDNALAYHDFVKENWEKNILAGTGKTWENVLQAGFEYKGDKPAQAYSFAGDVNAAAAAAVSASKALAKDVEVQLYQSVAIRDGK